MRVLSIRWVDRLVSSSGEWSGNLFDFSFRVYTKLIKNVKTPFKLMDGIRIDDTPVHKAIREVLANCLVNADYYLPRGIVIRQDAETITFANPGSIRVGKRQMCAGGKSDPRNKALMKMFTLIDIGERAGSGVPEIFAVWEREGWEKPQIDERIGDVERTCVTLKFRASDNRDNTSDKLTDTSDKILVYLEKHPQSKTKDIAAGIGLSPARTRAVLANMDTVVPRGANRNRTYSLRE